MSPESSNRLVTPQEEQNLRDFLSSTFPALADAPIVYTRICMYCDTNDGHFWIAPDPERPGLIVATGDSGHGFKFAPVLGEIIADAVEEKANPLLQKFRWRPEDPRRRTKRGRAVYSGTVAADLQAARSRGSAPTLFARVLFWAGVSPA